ncbi:rhomboid family intramembrane serine protease [Streptomyces sp. NPDC050738]|uniref:rhomboid family intramembrane serine protease n=1 Tax=Streptomyces sp. NPDC050738 TaxID=3154744 RepID=UPI00343B44FC
MDQVPGTPDQQPAASGLPSCYRHPGKETGIRCNRCDRPICPECMVSASVGFQCPSCVRGGSGTGHAPTANRPRNIAGGVVAADPHLVTNVLIGLNVAVFVAVLALGDRLVAELQLIGLAYDPSVGGVVGVADGQWYRLFTSMFLHQEFFHIGFNMLGLWWFGRPVEAALGRVRYLGMYLLSGLAGSAFVYLVTAPNAPVLGASGAVFGVLGANAVLLKRNNYDMRSFIGYVVISMIFSFRGGISWQAHLGGFVAGVLITIGLVYAPRERRALVQYGTCALVLAVTVAMVLMRTAALT